MASRFDALIEELTALLAEVAPKGWEGTVKAMKKKKRVSNPWALAHWMKKRGFHSHVKEDE